MASGVSVESAAVQGGMKCCTISIRELEDASSRLQRSYQQAGSGGWRDQKYADLGDIVEDCCKALTKPVSELRECMGKLEDLLKAIQAYEEVNL